MAKFIMLRELNVGFGELTACDCDDDLDEERFGGEEEEEEGEESEVEENDLRI